jgi:hypothetical protein
VRYKERRRSKRRRGDEEEEDDDDDDDSWSVVLWTDWGPINRRRLHKNRKSYLD